MKLIKMQIKLMLVNDVINGIINSNSNNNLLIMSRINSGLLSNSHIMLLDFQLM